MSESVKQFRRWLSDEQFQRGLRVIDLLGEADTPRDPEWRPYRLQDGDTEAVLLVLSTVTARVVQSMRDIRRARKEKA